ncbi:MAG: right-handed parallel beta-helix repeat-containing protein [Pseudomonadota bacterium]
MDHRCAIGLLALSLTACPKDDGGDDSGGPVNTFPSITLLSPADGDVLAEGEPLLVEAEVADAEEPPEDLRLYWFSPQDGVLSLDPADTDGHVSFKVADLAVGSHEIHGEVADSGDLIATVRVTVTVDGRPSAPVITLAPDPATSADDLCATIDTPSVDPEGDEVSYAWAWFVDGAPSGASTSATLPAHATTAGETWTVEVAPGDGIQKGPAGEASLLIGSAPPDAPGIAILPEGPVEDCDDLVCTVISPSTDPDGDAVTYSMTWTVDGTAWGAGETTTWPGDTVPAGTPRAGEVWTCTATPTDGLEEGIPGNASASILTIPCPVYTSPDGAADARGCHGDPLDTIAAAMAQAETDTCPTVILEPGTYDERVDFSGQAVTLTSESGPAVTTIAPSAGGTVVTFAAGEGPDSVLDGLTITGGTEHGLLIRAASPTVTGCVIRDNTGEDGAGVYASDYDGLFQGNTLSGNVASDAGGGLYLDGGSAVIDANRFEANEGGEAAGIWLEATATVSNNLVVGSVGDGILLHASGEDDLDDSNLLNNVVALSTHDGVVIGYYTTGPYAWQVGYASTNVQNNIFYEAGRYDVYGQVTYSTLPITGPKWHYNDVFGTGGYSQGGVPMSYGNFSQDPRFTDPSAGDFTLTWGSPCIDSGVDVGDWGVTTDIDGAPRAQGPAIDLGAWEYPGPTDDCDGVDDGPQCATGCPVYVDPNTLPGGNGDSAMPYASIPYAQAYRAACDEIVLRPGTYQVELDYGGEDLYIHSSEGPESAVLRSPTGRTVVTFEDGETAAAILEGVTVTNSIWGGIDIDGAAPTIRGCIITGNTGSNGAGVEAWDYDGLFQGNTVSLNTAEDEGGGFFLYGGSAVIDGNWFEANEASIGAGIWLLGTATVSNNVVLDSVGSGLFLASEWCVGDASFVLGNTLVGATTNGVQVDRDHGYGDPFCGATTRVVGNIIYGSGDDDVHFPVDEDYPFVDLTWQNNDVWGGNGYSSQDPGSTWGNISEDPAFVDEAAHDFHLAAASACIDQGQDLSAYGVTTDHDGTARPQGAAYDIGAYESY